MDDDFSLFDPLQPIDSSTKIIKPENSSETVVRSEEKSVDKTVILEDLLGGFSEEIKVDAVDGGDNDADRMRSTTSFFLLDLDNNEGGAADTALTDVTMTQSDHREGISKRLTAREAFQKKNTSPRWAKKFKITVFFG